MPSSSKLIRNRSVYGSQYNSRWLLSITVLHILQDEHYLPVLLAMKGRRQETVHSMVSVMFFKRSFLPEHSGTEN